MLHGLFWRLYYNNRDLLTLTQDAMMSGRQKYLATKYDELGRVEATGFLDHTPGFNPEATALGAINITEPLKLTTMEYYPKRTWVKKVGSRVMLPSPASQPMNANALGQMLYTENIYDVPNGTYLDNYTGNPTTNKQVNNNQNFIRVRCYVKI